MLPRCHNGPLEEESDVIEEQFSRSFGENRNDITYLNVVIAGQVTEVALYLIWSLNITYIQFSSAFPQDLL